ncbi:MAG: TetR/AcrR family transcriptional regulator, partial [Bacteroidales bacterium]|nr:TetR/AcrR family transcriptional regulator [Bacteroidales bacterium]
MARPTSVTKEKILAVAIDIVRNGGTTALTARTLFSALGCGANAVFSKFGSMEGVLEAVRTEARRLFKERVGAGFSLNPPFKGFGMAFLWFAMDEPQLYKMVMADTASATSFEEYIDTNIGFKQECLDAINQSFSLEERDAEMLYYQMVIVALGLAHTCV